MEREVNVTSIFEVNTFRLLRGGSHRRGVASLAAGKNAYSDEGAQKVLAKKAAT
jgi:hypothetical protein